MFTYANDIKRLNRTIFILKSKLDVYIKAILILKDFLNLEVDIDSYTLTTDFGSISFVNANKEVVGHLLLLKDLFDGDI